MNISRWMRRPIGLLAVSAMLGLSAQGAWAEQNPPGCDANSLSLTMNRSVNEAVPGQIVTFGVFVSVPPTVGGTPACDTVDVDIAGRCPDAAGLPVDPPIVLVTGASYPVGTLDLSVGSFDCVMPDVPVPTTVTAESSADGTLLDNPASGPGEGSPFSRVNTLTVNVQPCEVLVDKQVSCDGGVTWVDEALVENNEDGTDTCSALDTDTILVRYVSSNPSAACPLTGCVLAESNPEFGVPPGPFDLAPGDITPPVPAPNSPLCSDAFGDPMNPNEPNTVTLTCNTTGGPIDATDTASFSCLNVDLLVDRAVDCGTGAVDLELVRANDDGTNGCTALDGDPVNWAYAAQNAGTAPLYACELVDENPTVSAPIVVGTLAPGDLVPGIPATNNPVLCSDALETSETPDLGRVNLTCCTQDVGALVDCNVADRVAVHDISTVTCETPADLMAEKICIDTDADGIDDRVDVIATAGPGDVGFTNCVATDTIHLDDPTCPPVGPGTNIPLTPLGGVSPFDLAPNASETLFGTLPALTDNACNTAEVSCDSPAGPVQAVAPPVVCMGRDEGCLTRTPGFWGNRPDVTSNYLDIEVCGNTLDNVGDGSTSSAIEAICSVGKDHKQFDSPQEAQLVRQCTAAALNLAVTEDEGGFCGDSIEGSFAACCGADSTCTGGVGGPSVNECISILDEFNNQLDTLDSDVFSGLGRADSRNCRASRNNGVVVLPAAP